MIAAVNFDPSFSGEYTCCLGHDLAPSVLVGVACSRILQVDSASSGGLYS